MTTSGVVTFSVSENDIITTSMQFIGALGESEVPTAQEYTDCRRVLNMLVKQWMGRSDFSSGMKMWSRKRADLVLDPTKVTYNLGPSGDRWAADLVKTTLSVTAANNSSSVTVASVTGIASANYIGIVLDSNTIFWTTVNGAPSGNVVSLTANTTGQASSGAVVYCYKTYARRPLSIISLALRDKSGNDVPLDPMLTVQAYESLPSKANTNAQGDPSLWYYESQLTNGTLNFDMLPSDLTKHFHITYMSPAEDFVSSTDTPEYPQQYYLPLCWGLGKQIAPMFKLPWTENMQSNYTESVLIAFGVDPDMSDVYFQPGLV
jgi:hypothetical protein